MRSMSIPTKRVLAEKERELTYSHHMAIVQRVYQKESSIREMIDSDQQALKQNYLLHEKGQRRRQSIENSRIFNENRRLFSALIHINGSDKSTPRVKDIVPITTTAMHSTSVCMFSINNNNNNNNNNQNNNDSTINDNLNSSIIQNNLNNTSYNNSSHNNSSMTAASISATRNRQKQQENAKIQNDNFQMAYRMICLPSLYDKKSLDSAYKLHKKQVKKCQKFQPDPNRYPFPQTYVYPQQKTRQKQYHAVGVVSPRLTSSIIYDQFGNQLLQKPVPLSNSQIPSAQQERQQQQHPNQGYQTPQPQQQSFQHDPPLFNSEDKFYGEPQRDYINVSNLVSPLTWRNKSNESFLSEQKTKHEINAQRKSAIEEVKISMKLIMQLKESRDLMPQNLCYFAFELLSNGKEIPQQQQISPQFQYTDISSIKFPLCFSRSEDKKVGLPILCSLFKRTDGGELEDEIIGQFLVNLSEEDIRDGSVEQGEYFEVCSEFKLNGNILGEVRALVLIENRNRNFPLENWQKNNPSGNFSQNVSPLQSEKKSIDMLSSQKKKYDSLRMSPINGRHNINRQERERERTELKLALAKTEISQLKVDICDMRELAQLDESEETQQEANIQAMVLSNKIKQIQTEVSILERSNRGFQKQKYMLPQNNKIK